MVKISEEKKQEAIKIGLTTPFWRFAQEIGKNKEKFQHLTGTREGMSDEDSGWTFMGLYGASLLIAIAISLTIFIWALVVLIKYGKTMPTWALVVAIIFFFLPPGPIVSLIVVYLTKGKKKGGFNFF